jgi:hypothetical protein
MARFALWPMARSLRSFYGTEVLTISHRLYAMRYMP